MDQAIGAEKQPVFWRSGCVMRGWAHTGEGNTILMDVFWWCGEGRRQQGLFFWWCKSDDIWPQTFWCLKADHRQFYFYLHIYIYVLKKTKGLLSLSFKERQCFDVTRYGAYTSVLLCVFQYMQQMHDRNKEKTSRRLVWQITSF